MGGDRRSAAASVEREAGGNEERVNAPQYACVSLQTGAVVAAVLPAHTQPSALPCEPPDSRLLERLSDRC